MKRFDSLESPNFGGVPGFKNLLMAFVVRLLLRPRWALRLYGLMNSSESIFIYWQLDPPGYNRASQRGNFLGGKPRPP